MATQMYTNWVHAGRPFKLALPVAQYRSAFLAAGWPVTSIGTLGDEAHLQAATPEDHTPFSVTGWPQANPYPYVHAIDVSHDVSRETILDSLVTRWISDARAGRTPWVKYIIYKGHSWSVRSAWEQRNADNHFDHVHVSMRTDYTTTSIGTWNPIGTGIGDDMLKDEVIPLPAAEFPELLGQDHEVASTVLAWTGARARRQEVEMSTLKGVVNSIYSAVSRPPVIDADELAHALVAQQGFIDAIAAAVASKLTPAPTADEVAHETVALLGKEIVD